MRIGEKSQIQDSYSLCQMSRQADPADPPPRPSFMFIVMGEESSGDTVYLGLFKEFMVSTNLARCDLSSSNRCS